MIKVKKKRKINQVGQFWTDKTNGANAGIWLGSLDANDNRSLNIISTN